MNLIISFFRLVIFIFLLGLCLPTYGQTFTPIQEPEIDVNWRLGDRWTMNAGFATRHRLDEEYAFRQVEISHNTSYEIGFYSKLSLGFINRWRNTFNNDRKDETIIIGQYAHAKKYNRIKLAHRFQSQVRLRKNLTINRNRYRISAELPLSGRKVDLKEFFIVGSTEALWSLSEKRRPEIGQRFSFDLGYKISNAVQAIIGSQFRFDNYNIGVTRDLLINSGIVIKI
jgi:hypothetical protein